MIITVLNLFALLIATFAVLAFAVVFGFFVFILFACAYIGWNEIKDKSISNLWERIKK